MGDERNKEEEDKEAGGKVERKGEESREGKEWMDEERKKRIRVGGKEDEQQMKEMEEE